MSTTYSSRSEVDKPTSLNVHFHVAIINALWHITVGSRFDYDDHDLHKLIEMTGHVVRFRSLDSDSFMPMILFFLPWITRLFPTLSGWNNFLDSFKAIFPILTKYIEEHKVNFDPERPNPDFIDLYLKHMGSISDPNSSFFKDSGGDFYF